MSSSATAILTATPIISSAGAPQPLVMGDADQAAHPERPVPDGAVTPRRTWRTARRPIIGTEVAIQLG